MQETKQLGLDPEQLEFLRNAGFNDDQIDIMASVKKRFADGDFSDRTTEYNRRMFARYLIQTGRLDNRNQAQLKQVVDSKTPPSLRSTGLLKQADTLIRFIDTKLSEKVDADPGVKTAAVTQKPSMEQTTITQIERALQAIAQGDALLHLTEPSIERLNQMNDLSNYYLDKDAALLLKSGFIGFQIRRLINLKILYRAGVSLNLTHEYNVCEFLRTLYKKGGWENDAPLTSEDEEVSMPIQAKPHYPTLRKYLRRQQKTHQFLQYLYLSKLGNDEFITDPVTYQKLCNTPTRPDPTTEEIEESLRQTLADKEKRIARITALEIDTKTQEAKTLLARLGFARWLYNHGHIKY